MRLKNHEQFALIFVIGIILLVLVVEIDSTDLYNPNAWAEMSINFGAAILTVVSIITSIVTSSVNKERSDFVNIQSDILNLVEERNRILQDESLSNFYREAINNIHKLINDQSPMKYTESYIGFGSFFSFLISIVFAIYGVHFKLVYATFFIGFALLISYIIYCIIEFRKIDALSIPPTKEGELTLSSISINGNDVNILDDQRNEEKVILTPQLIEEFQIRTTFNGKTRNGFLHAMITFDDGSISHIPDVNTHLSNRGFIQGNRLALYGGKDTGMLHCNGMNEFSFYIKLCGEGRGANNEFLGNMNFNYVGRADTYLYPDIPENVKVENILFRIFEDPLYTPNQKRRAIDLINIQVKEGIA